jgi:Skp family chaperone for outer membrane proteins
MQQAQQESRNAFVKEYQPVVRDFVSDYVKANGFSLVLDSQVVLWNESEPDISESILNSFDEWYQKQNNTSELSGS